MRWKSAIVVGLMVGVIGSYRLEPVKIRRTDARAKISLGMFPKWLQGRLPFRVISGGTDPLFDPADLTYEGFFQVPAGTGTNCPDYCGSYFSDGVMAVDETGNGGQGSIYFMGLNAESGPVQAKVAEISQDNDLTGGAMDPADTLVSQGPTAVLIQNFVEPTGGVQRDYGGNKASGLLVADVAGTSRLILSVETAFGTNDVAGQTHFVLDKTLANQTVIAGPFAIISDWTTTTALCASGPTCPDGYVAQSQIPIPAAYQAALGGDILSGMADSSIINRTSHGPTGTAWFLSDISGTTAITGAKFLYGWPGGHQNGGLWVDLGDVGAPRLVTVQNDWNRAFWPDGYRGPVHFYVRGDPYGSCYCDAVAGDADGDPVQEPIGTVVTRITGSDASTDVAGTTITVPNADISGVLTDLNKTSNFIWLSEQSSPTNVFANRNYVSVSHISGTANSGTPSASVTVTPALTGNLTNQDYVIGMLAAYDPDIHGDTGFPDTPWGNNHPPQAWPYLGYWYAYDANDLIATAADPGANPAWDTMPYSTETSWDSQLPYPGGKYKRFRIGAMAHSVTRHKVFLFQKEMDAAGAGVIHVFGYPAAPPRPTPLLPMLSASILALLWPRKLGVS